MSKPLEPTPQHELKPSLQWVGKLLGRDIYMDTRDEKLRDITERLIKRLTEETTRE